jgi:Carbohydrate esterase, sialic acid-specific acetylesterase
MKTWPLACIALASASGWAATAPKVYLLMGQSNMSGRGDLAALPRLPEDPAIRLYGNDGVFKTAVEPLDSAAGQIDIVSADSLAAVGPGLSFARTLRTKYDEGPVILVPCAKGGVSIKQWAPDLTRDTLYGSCLARAKTALTQGELGGVLWYQGETDTASLEDAAAWSGRMSALVARLRQDLSAPNMPWVVVGLADYPTASKKPYPGWSAMQAAQAALPSQIPYLAHVSAAGLTTNADTLHLDTAAQLQLGPKLADAVVHLRTKQHRPAK